MQFFENVELLPLDKLDFERVALVFQAAREGTLEMFRREWSPQGLHASVCPDGIYRVINTPERKLLQEVHDELVYYRALNRPRGRDTLLGLIQNEDYVHALCELVLQSLEGMAKNKKPSF